MILIFSEETDVHFQRVRRELEAKCDYAVVNTSKFPRQTQISYEFGEKSKPNVEFVIDGRKVSGDDVRAIWYRRTPPPISTLTSVHLQEYVGKESQLFLDALPSMMDRAFWLSNPNSVRIASLKPHQLILASSLGLTIPESFFGNLTSNAKKLVSKNESSIVKAINMPSVAVKGNDSCDCFSFFTRSVTRGTMIENIDQVQNCPVIMQPYIDKEFELRITVVGEQVFACAIHSQMTSSTKEDWRQYDLKNTPHEAFELPDTIRTKLVELVKDLGLVFGCIDMIVTKTGEFIFLEINPNGQWLWIQELTGMPIAEAIAQLLLTHDNC